MNGEWNIYDEEGRALLQFDTFLSMEYARAARVADQPVEQGGFASFNKLAVPGELVVRLARTGAEAELAAFAQTLDELTAQAARVRIRVPERLIPNLTLTQARYGRAVASGANRILATLRFQEIREAGVDNGGAFAPRIPWHAGLVDRGRIPARSLTSLETRALGLSLTLSRAQEA